MAEVRKVKPGRGGAIAAAIEQAMGASARPVTPGGSPDPSTAPGSKPAEPTSFTATSFLLNESFVVAPAPESDPAHGENPRPVRTEAVAEEVEEA